MYQKKGRLLMKKIYYLIGVHGGVEPFTRGPFPDKEKRNDTAKIIHKTQKVDDSLFWADVDEKGGLTVGSYLAGFFWQEYENNED